VRGIGQLTHSYRLQPDTLTKKSDNAIAAKCFQAQPQTAALASPSLADLGIHALCNSGRDIVKLNWRLKSFGLLLELILGGADVLVNPKTAIAFKRADSPSFAQDKAS
jgi:hypothetical protein